MILLLNIFFFKFNKYKRNISKNTTVVIPAHFIPAFKPAKTFSERVKRNVKVAEPLDNKQTD